MGKTDPSWINLAMAELVPPIRNTPRAVVIQDDQVLLLRKEGDERGERYALPGGAQELGESLHEALLRECLEEIDTQVQIDELVYVAEFFKLRETMPPTRRQYMEFLFLCQVPQNYTPRNGPHPDKHQVEVVWRNIKELPALTLFPMYLQSALKQIHSGQPTYLGTFHERAAAT